MNPTLGKAMQSALRITTKVLPGNKVEVQLPPGSEGEEVDVFVVLPTKPETKPSNVNVLDLIEEARRHRIGMTAEEIDRYLQTERESWDR
jgi:hypothetical protein